MDLSTDVVRDSSILNVDEFVNVVNEALTSLNAPNVKKSDLIFLVEPAHVFLRFVVVDKATEDIDLTILESAREKLSGVGIDIEDLYFAYQKIAPFVYQFVAIRKDDLEQYLDIANKLGIPLKAVIPWVLLLPKFLKSNDPCVFIIKNEMRNVIALSELNGIFYSEDFGEDKKEEDIQELVQQLSVYKRAEPIHKVYTITDSKIELDDSFEVNPLDGISGTEEDIDGYELHLMTSQLVNNSGYLNTLVNLLNLLPVPVVAKKKNYALVYVGVAALLLLVGGYFLYSRRTNDTLGSDDLTAMETQESPVVLSNQDDEETAPENTEETNNEENTTEVSLDKSELKIRIENGAGIQGIAGNTQTYLEGKEYTVISIGNAAEVGREDTLLKFKPSFTKFKDLVVTDMESDYTVVVEEDLDESLEYDLLVVVGKN